jgi:hemolysin activation/secretion protein
LAGVARNVGTTCPVGARRTVSRFQTIFALLCLTTLLVPVEASAQLGAGQIAPPSSPIERAIPERQPQAAPPLQITPAPELPAEESHRIVTIHAVDIDGATVYATTDLAAFYSGIIDRPIEMGEVAGVVERIQAKYRGDGYFLTVVRGTIEPANNTVTLRIRVVEGFISSVKLDGDIGPAGVQVYRFLEKLTNTRPANIRDVERGLLLAQDVPGVSVRAVLRPGTGEPGAVDLIAQVGRKPFDAFLQFDNRASPFAGPGELLLGAYANSFTSIGERTEVIIYDTPFNDQQVFGQAAVEGFVGSSGLKLRGYVGYGSSNPGGGLASVGFAGRLLLAGISASYPLIRTRPLSLSLTAAFDIEQSEIDTQTAGVTSRQSNSDLRVIRLGESLTFQDDSGGLGLTGANLVAFTAHQGIEGLGSTRNNDPLAPRTGNRNDFRKFSGEITRVQDLFQVSDFLFALKLSAGGQYTDDILPPTEKYFAGGTRFGRGFFSGEVTGDRALGTTIELQVNTAVEVPWHIGLQPYVYYDNGLTWDLDNGRASHRVESTGIGLRAAPTPQVSAEVELSHRFTRQPTGANVSREGANVLFVGATARY